MPESRAMTLAILSALPEEQHGLAALLEDTQVVARAGRRFVRGHLHGQPLVLGLTGIGKVAAATTTTTLIEHLDVQQLVFTGVAGGIGAGVQVGDVVVAQAFLQHDMDVRPLFPRWQVPGYGAAAFGCDPALVQRLQQAAQACTAQAATWQDPLLGARAPRAHAGLVVSGDQFIATAEASQRIVDDLQTAAHAPLAVEMEGAAIASPRSAPTTACHLPPSAPFPTGPTTAPTWTSPRSWSASPAATPCTWWTTCSHTPACSPPATSHAPYPEGI